MQSYHFILSKFSIFIFVLNLFVFINMPPPPPPRVEANVSKLYFSRSFNLILITFMINMLVTGDVGY